MGETILLDGELLNKEEISKKKFEKIGPGRQQEPTEQVVHPQHYNKGIEVIDFIESWDMNFNCGCATKYIARHPYKGNPVQDLEKAKFYLEREIERLKKHEEREK